jgi:type I restriction enzyme R subunit
LHFLRKEGNTAVHDVVGGKREALAGLRIARQVAIWLHRAFGKPSPQFKAGPFVEPALVSYAARLAQLEKELQIERGAFDSARQTADAERLRRDELERQNTLLAGERDLWERLAQDEEDQRKTLEREFEARLRAVRSEAISGTASDRSQVVAAAAQASKSLHLDEAETRTLIDAQLRDAGWEADSGTWRSPNGRRGRVRRTTCCSAA